MAALGRDRLYAVTITSLPNGLDVPIGDILRQRFNIVYLFNDASYLGPGQTTCYKFQKNASEKRINPRLWRLVIP